ncbi:MAG: ATP-grasp domain-containing protein, partial [Acidobacteria bacterium]|nr:ATP-grasp domain-containing protein [Acidobacteriota bacterium]
RSGLVVDLANLDDDEAAARVRTYQPAGILTLADAYLVRTAELAHRLSLPFHSPETARVLTDKWRQREVLERAGLTVPRRCVVSEGMVDDAAVVTVGFPAVVKPRVGEASRFTEPVASLEELRARIDEFRNEGALGEFVLESYIPDAPKGRAGENFAGYVSVESAVANGEIRHVAITGRTPPAWPFRETGFFIPAQLEAKDQLAVLDVTTSALESLGVENACSHTEVKLSPTGPVIIEVNGRIGGGVPEMIERATNQDFLGAAMDISLGREPQVSSLAGTQQLAYLLYVHAPDDVKQLARVDGLEALAEVEGVEEIILNRSMGDLLHWSDGNHGHVYSVAGSVQSHDDFRRILHEVDNCVTIVGE